VAGMATIKVPFRRNSGSFRPPAVAEYRWFFSKLAGQMFHLTFLSSFGHQALIFSVLISSIVGPLDFFTTLEIGFDFFSFGRQHRTSSFKVVG
jgi:hypothetical protein